MPESTKPVFTDTVEDVERIFSAHARYSHVENEVRPWKFETKRELLLRILISCKFEAEHAVRVLIEHVNWRELHHVDEIAEQTLQTLLELESDAQVQEFVHCFPSIERGVDKNGKTIVYFLASQLDIRRARQLCSKEMIFKYLIWTRERSFAKLKYSPTGFPKPPPYYISVLDCRNISMSNATNSDFYAFLKNIVDVDGHYAGRIGRMVIINVPSFFQFVWGVIKTRFGTEVEKKIMICTNANQEQVLLDMVGGDKSQLPVEYGGSADGLPQQSVFCTSVNFMHDVKLSQVVANAAAAAAAAKAAEVEAAAARAKRVEASVDAKRTAQGALLPREDLLQPPPPSAAPTAMLATPPPPQQPISASKRNEMLLSFQQEYERCDTLVDKQALKRKLIEAILKLERDTSAFEMDMLMVRARRRREAMLVLEEEFEGGNDGRIFRSEREVQLELDIVRQEREALDRSMAFAKNYIEVQNQEWLNKQRALRARLDRVMDENRGLRKTMQDAMLE